MLHMVQKDSFSSRLYLPKFSIPTPPITLTSRGTNTLNDPKTNIPSPSAHLQTSANASTPTTLAKRKKKSNYQLWHQNLWLWTVALHLCYQCQTLILTTVDSWKTGVVCEIITCQRQDHVWSTTLQCFSCNLGLQDCLTWKLSEQTQYPYRTGVICGVVLKRTIFIFWNEPFLLATTLNFLQKNYSSYLG